MEGYRTTNLIIGDIWRQQGDMAPAQEFPGGVGRGFQLRGEHPRRRHEEFPTIDGISYLLFWRRDLHGAVEDGPRIARLAMGRMVKC